jgi:hypothetical protein
MKVESWASWIVDGDAMSKKAQLDQKHREKAPGQ